MDTAPENNIECEKAGGKYVKKIKNENNKRIKGRKREFFGSGNRVRMMVWFL